MQIENNPNAEHDSKLGGLVSGPANNETPHQNVPNTPPDAMPTIQETMASLRHRVDNLEEKVNDLELDIKSTITCRVCYKNVPVDGVSHVNVLGCGHAFCNVCALSMRHCAMCNAPVVGKFKLFI